jgi:hypothetical protein
MVEPSTPHCRGLTISLCSAALFALVFAGCSNGEALTAADHAKCQSLGFAPGTNDYNLCLLQQQRQRTSLAAVPEQLRDE